MGTKKNKVAYRATSVYSIPLAFFLSLKVKAVVVDLDNTLDSAYAKEPRKEAFQLKEKIEKAGMHFLVVSNNQESHVGPYCQKLNAIYLSSANKFCGRKIKRWLSSLSLKVEECIFIGDQLFTDRIYVNHLKGRLVLTEPLVKKDNIYTRLIRRYDNYKRTKWLKKGLLGQKVD